MKILLMIMIVLAIILMTLATIILYISVAEEVKEYKRKIGGCNDRATNN